MSDPGSGREESFRSWYRHGTLVIWPPDTVRRTVNALRQRYDPASQAVCEAHITLTWPFLEQPDKSSWLEIAGVVQEIALFEVDYGPLGYFPSTPCIYLQVQPARLIQKLHQDLLATGLFADNPAIPPDVFIPHMSLTDGYPDQSQTRMIIDALTGFEPVGSFPCPDIAYIVPDQDFAFQVQRRIPFGGSS